MAIIDVEVEMDGSSDAEATPIRQISVSAVLRGIGASGPTPKPQPTPPDDEKPE